MQINCRIPEIVLGALLAVGLIAMGFVLVSSKGTSPTTQQITTQHSDEKNTHSQESKSLWIPEDATGFFTLWVALFTGVLAFSTVKLYGSTRDAANAAKTNADALMNAEGAQLWMDEVKIHGIRTTPGTLKLTYIIRNFGNSPGWVHHKPMILLIRKTLPEDRDLDQTQTPETSFVPAKHFTAGETVIPVVMPQPVIDAILAPNPTMFIFIYGSINYRDIFKRERRAGFAYKIKFGSGDVSESFPIAGGRDYWDYQ